jgi:hypothetical protein
MIEKKAYAGVVLQQSLTKIASSDFMADIEGFSEDWAIEFAGDTIKSVYTYADKSDAFVRLYMNVSITTGQVLSLQRNSSGNVYWWTEQWTPMYTTKETHKFKKTKLPKRTMNGEEKKCVKMFETVIQMVTGTLSLGNSQADSLIYKCFTQKKFAKNVKFDGWEGDILNSLFSYRFDKKGIHEGNQGYYVVAVNLLSKKQLETFSYHTVDPFITEKSENGFTTKSNPNFDPNKHVMYISMTGLLLSDLLKAF